jgi:glycosyltransferase involved in cell wall biosynthesis
MNILWVTQIPSASFDHMHYDYLQVLSERIDGKLILVVHPRYNGKLLELPIQIEPFHSKGKLHFSSIRQIRQLIQNNAIDVVVALTSRTLANTVLASYGLRRAPKICGRYGITAPLYPWRFENYLTFLHPRVSHVFCVSKAARDAVSESLPSYKTSVSYPYTGKTADNSSRAEIFAKFNIPPDAFVLICVANFRPVKGVDIFLRTTFNLACYSDIHWLYVGEDNHALDSCINPVVRHRVHRLGLQPHVSQLLQHCDAFVMASRAEGIGRALLEAMSLGLCPIVTRVGGMPEAVIDGVSGLLVERDDIEGLAHAISRIYQDKKLRRRLAQGALDKIKVSFSLNGIVSHFLDTFTRLHDE